MKMKMMMITKSLRMLGTVEGGATRRVRLGRLCAAKTPDRAAVHGVKQPPNYTLDDRDRIEQEIDKAKGGGKIRKEVEEKVDSQLKNSKNVVQESPESLSSS